MIYKTNVSTRISDLIYVSSDVQIDTSTKELQLLSSKLFSNGLSIPLTTIKNSACFCTGESFYAIYFAENGEVYIEENRYISYPEYIPEYFEVAWGEYNIPLANEMFLEYELYVRYLRSFVDSTPIDLEKNLSYKINSCPIFPDEYNVLLTINSPSEIRSLVRLDSFTYSISENRNRNIYEVTVNL